MKKGWRWRELLTTQVNCEQRARVWAEQCEHSDARADRKHRTSPAASSDRARERLAHELLVLPAALDVEERLFVGSSVCAIVNVCYVLYFVCSAQMCVMCARVKLR